MRTPSSYPVLDNRPIDQWKVTELKEELKRRKLMTRGLKEDLVKRLDEALRNENESAMENVDNGFDGTPQPVVETKDGRTVHDVSETAGDAMGMDQVHVDDTAVSVSEGKVQEGEVTARDEEMVVQSQTVVETEDASTVLVGSETAEDMTDHGNDNNEVDRGMNQAPVDHKAVSLGEGKVQEGEVSGIDSARDEEVVVQSRTVVETEDARTVLADSETVGDMMDHGNDSNEVDHGMNQAPVDDTTVSSGEGKIQEVEEMVIRETCVETSITVQESVVSQVAVTAQELQNNDSPNERDLKSLMENEEIKPPHEDVGLESSDPNNQVSEVSTVLGFQVKSDSISSDCVSIDETNELKDNIIADNVKLELDVKPEMVQPLSSDVLPDGNELHPMDVEEPGENKVLIQDRDDEKAANAEMSKKNDIADVIFSEKLNLDRSSGEDSVEDDALEVKQIDSKYNLDEVGHRGQKTEVSLVKEEAPVDIMQDDMSVDKKDILDEDKNASAAPPVKRKLHDEVVVNNEISKRQRRWNSEALKVPEPPSNPASATTPKDSPLSTSVKRSFSRSDSTASEDPPKERVVPPSAKPPTNSLRIDRFLRPFTLKAVQELLGKTGSVSSFWMDHIKTHCYVTYSSVEEAIETRNAVYNLQWPTNGGRLLLAEFVDPQEVKIRVEPPPPQSPATPASTRPAMPSAPPSVPPQPASRQQAQRQQLPPPPPPPPTLSNPPQARERLELPPPPPLSNPAQARERLQLPPPPPLPEKVETPILTLDDLFRKTKATPRIYYLPLSEEQVAAKLKAQGKSTKQ